jgi:hypothetical protein
MIREVRVSQAVSWGLDRVLVSDWNLFPAELLAQSSCPWFARLAIFGRGIPSAMEVLLFRGSRGERFFSSLIGRMAQLKQLPTICRREGGDHDNL